MWKLLSRSEVPRPTESIPNPKAHQSADTPRQQTSAAPSTTIPPGTQSDSLSSEASLRNRRESPRYSAVKESLWLGWWAEDEFVLVDAELVNISEGGVQIAVATAPAAGQVVWMRLEGTSTQSSLAALVLESRWVTLRRHYNVRLEFQERCPSDFYNSAIFGE